MTPPRQGFPKGSYGIQQLSNTAKARVKNPNNILGQGEKPQ